ncbi:hypothetical protein N431DRAFT_441610 [Stipitochalara longipes BDJ]|nr:hypothetical protein N431DRAFT_441610 [Stipitochalara longipes BDJ]
MAEYNHGDWIGRLPEDFKDLIDGTPEDLQDNPLILYFRCKYNKRDELKAIFSLTERTKIELELERIDKLRSTFGQHVENGPHVQRMTISRNLWRTYAKDLCRKSSEKETVETLSTQAPTEEKRERYRNYLSLLRRVGDWSILTDSVRPSTSLEEDKGYGFPVQRITLKRKEKSRESGTSSFGEYSMKTYPVHDVLYNKDKNPLTEECEKDTIRYFHFPANCMLWVEEAIGRYYGEDRGEYNYRKANNYCKKSSNILCREFWTAQQHGGISDPIHARHMRSHCSFISVDHDSTKATVNGHTSPTPKSSKNFVIFMPYLHWETDKHRRKMAEVTKDVTQKHRKNLREEFPHLDMEREDVAKIVEKVRIKYGSRVPSDGMMKKALPDHHKRSPLAQYLLDAASLHDAMDIEPDVRLLSENLHPHNTKIPPLHGRRTLDQSYYWKLENTGRRDEDQVVYRGTKAGNSIYRTTRVVMVDQLWLYILDDNTIISFFPRRWGRNKPDFSGVHRGIRSRLEHLRPGEIQSVYDLALIIMNQCSTVFFDRTKPADARPQVLDIFANAIADVSEMKTIAFEGFWRHLDNMHLNSPQLTNIEAIEASARIYLDVNPEGMLLREAHDIMDELRMMARIYFHQLRVTKHFSKNLHDLNEQEAPLTSKELLQELNRNLEGINSRQTGAKLDSDMHTIVPRADKEVARLHRPIPDGTLYRVRSLLEDLEIRLNELQDLEESTKEITEHLKALLDLKQQQASIIEAKSALARADESVTQGRAIVMFTIITIIFLPLSFMSSLFGMNARELSNANGGIMSLRYQFKFMLSLALAFSSWIRNLISFFASVLWAAFTEYTNLRRLWNFVIQKNNAKGLHQSKRKLTAKIYDRRKRMENRKALARAKVVEKSKKDGIPLEPQRSRRSGRSRRAGSTAMV